jgi:hypothetical protein
LLDPINVGQSAIAGIDESKLLAKYQKGCRNTQECRILHHFPNRFQGPDEAARPPRFTTQIIFYQLFLSNAKIMPAS